MIIKNRPFWWHSMYITVHICHFPFPFVLFVWEAIGIRYERSSLIGKFLVDLKAVIAICYKEDVGRVEDFNLYEGDVQ